MTKLTEAQSEALWSCYSYLLSLPAEQTEGKESEDADELAGDTASSDSSTEMAERNPSVPSSSDTSTPEEEPQQ